MAERAGIFTGGILRLAAAGLLDLIYPTRCLVCERPACPFLCTACAARFVPVPEPTCIVCGRPEEGGYCRHCATFAPDGEWGFTAARAAGIYQGPLRHAIHQFKYGRAEMLGEPLGAYLANRCWVDGLITGPVDCVVPVPIHPTRERARGFNQAALLAAPVAAMRGLPLLGDVVRRARKTPPQVGLSPEARRTNLAGAFLIPDESALRGRSVLLVDDVFTTGATMRAAARALRQMLPARLVVAVPIASPDTCEEFEDEVDEIVCARTPEPFLAVGYWYEDFSQTSDEQVRDLLARPAKDQPRVETSFHAAGSLTEHGSHRKDAHGNL